MTLVEPRWDDARSALVAAAAALPARRLPLSQCDGLMLAEDLVALVDLPSFDTSAMDGWAVRGPGPWRLLPEASLAGRPSQASLADGEAVVIATGAVVPASADAVIRSEDGDVGASGQLVAATPAARTHIRPAGEECRAGELLVAAGGPVTPSIIGLAAAAGHDTLVVVPRARAALVLFGDELVTSGLPTAGRVRDSLGPQVPAWLRRLGADVVLVESCEDTLPAHVEAIARARDVADLILTTGGTAAGPVDHLHAAIEQLDGSLVVDSVAVRPGHPMLAATLPARADRDPGGQPRPVWLVGLPGNPQSAIVTLVSLAAPLLGGLAGQRAADPGHLPGVALSEAVTAPAHEDRLVLGSCEAGRFTPGGHLGSGMLRGLASATGFAVIPPGGAPAGSEVRWLALP